MVAVPALTETTPHPDTLALKARVSSTDMNLCSITLSVVFLISLPYSIVAGFISFLYWRSRQARNAERARPALHLVPAVSGKEDGR